jgi:hypothetical protein
MPGHDGQKFPLAAKRQVVERLSRAHDQAIDSRYFSASRAAMQPEPADVIA